MTKLSTKTATELLDRAIEAGKIEKAGNWFSFAGDRLGNGKSAAVAFLVENAETAEKIEAALAPAPDLNGSSATSPADTKVAVIGSGVDGGGTETLKRETAKRSAPTENVALSFPLPAGIPEQVLKSASIVVKSKAAHGRRRAGRAFTPEETAIPYADVSAEQIEALTGDPELIVSLRLAKPD